MTGTVWTARVARYGGGRFRGEIIKRWPPGSNRTGWQQIHCQHFWHKSEQAALTCAEKWAAERNRSGS